MRKMGDYESKLEFVEKYKGMEASVDSYVSPAAQMIGKFHIQSKETNIAYARFGFPKKKGWTGGQTRILRAP